MDRRQGEKIGWVVGWYGGFLWVALLAILFLGQGKRMEGLTGLTLVVFAGLAIHVFAPWRHPKTLYWRLMIPPFVVLFGTVVWGVWAYGGLEANGLDGWSFFLFLPLLLPFGSVGKKRWHEEEKE